MNLITWTPTRWERATHTFDGNNVDFIEENVVFQGGLDPRVSVSYTHLTLPTKA